MVRSAQTYKLNFTDPCFGLLLNPRSLMYSINTQRNNTLHQFVQIHHYINIKPCHFNRLGLVWFVLDIISITGVFIHPIRPKVDNFMT